MKKPTISLLPVRIAKYLAQLAPHVAARDAATLLKDALAELEELERQIANARMDCSYWKERFEQSEQRIAESQRQEQVAHTIGGQDIMWHLSKTELPPKGTKFYRSPIISPTVEEAVKAERGACAKLCESEWVGDSINDDECGISDMAYNEGRRDCAAAIRARSKP